MKKLNIFLLIAFLLCSCTQTATAVPTSTPVQTNTPAPTQTQIPTVTPTSTPSPTPCVEPVTPIQIGDVSLYLHCGVENATEIEKVVRNSVSIQNVKADYHVFGKNDVEAANTLLHNWLKAHNYTPDYGFSEGKSGGITNPNLSIFYEAENWHSWGPNMVESVVAHEYEHLIQYDLASNNSISPDWPAWFVEGTAYYVANQQIINLEGHSDYYPRCENPPNLSELSNWGTVKDSECVYSGGYIAAEEMWKAKGVEGYHDLLSELKKGSSFASAFNKIYGITLDEFYKNLE